MKPLEVLIGGRSNVSVSLQWQTLSQW